MSASIVRRPPPALETRFSDSYSPLLQRVLSARGMQSDDDISLRLRDLLPPTLKGLDEAVELLVAAMSRGQRIVVVGDFDCDGATSCALFIKVMSALGYANVGFIVPNRFEFGYGLTPEIIDFLAPQKPDLIVTVDNGIASLEGVDYAKSLGISVLITDHHLPGCELPNADAIVNPNQPGCDFESKALAGVGVVFYLMLALRARLRDSGWFEQLAIEEPDLAEYLDLVALGTVADVVPLDKNNRILAEQGIRRIRKGQCCVGIQAILQVAGRSASRLVASDLGFSVAPRLNAAGRLDDISIGIMLLLTDDVNLASDIATELDNFNKDRRSIEQGMKREAESAVTELLDGSEFDGSDTALPAALSLFNPSWHQGVVGIVASRIKEQFHRPCICFAPESDEVDCRLLKGSARSIQGLHIRDALDLVSKRSPGIIYRFGGHAMAAGLTLEKENFAAFQQAFAEVARELLNDEDLEKRILSDGELEAQEIELGTASELKRALPWGQTVPEPLFDGRFVVVNQRIVGGSHLKLALAHPQDLHTTIDAIAFNIDVEQWPDRQVKDVEIAYSLDVNEYRGRESVQLLVRQINKVA